MASRQTFVITFALATGASLILMAATALPALAYTPRSPEVRAIIIAAVAYLEEHGEHGRVGGKALVGLAFLKDGAAPEHPRVAAAIAACRKFAEKVPTATGDRAYDAGLALIFLCEQNPAAYSTEIANLVQYFVVTQKPHGGYGYADRETGDNSMTQYAALGLWLAHQNGFDVPPETVGKLANWIISVQDPSGGFGYQGNVASEGRVGQSPMRLSLTAAGLCSLYVSADALGLSNRRSWGEIDLPPELEEITPDSARSMRAGAKFVDRQELRETKRLGDEWMEAHYAIDGGQWQFYYLYALERFKAFQELDLGHPDAESSWYDDGVKFIREQQQEDGSVRGASEDAAISTAFAVLFLLRGTAETIKRHARTFEHGLLAGGRGLPNDLSHAELRNGKIVDATEVPATERLMELLESEDGNLDNLVDADVAFDWEAVGSQERAAALETLRQKLHRGQFSARLMAVRAIRDSNDFESVPALIHALSDPDPRIVLEARDTLRLLSRKIDGFGLPANSTSVERLAAVEKWQAWYLSLRPVARFSD